MRDNYPELSAVTSLVERENATENNNYTITYRPVSEEAKERLQELVHDPLISGLAYYSYLNHYMKNFVQVKLPELEPNQTDYYLISFRGPGGAATFLQALQDSPDKPAHTMFITDSHPDGYTHPFIEQNRSVYFDTDRNQYRTYQEVYDYIADDVGIGRVLVQDRVENALATLVNIDNQEPNTIISANAVIFSENIIRPILRPDRATDPAYAMTDDIPSLNH